MSGSGCSGGGPFADETSAAAFVATKTVGTGGQASQHWLVMPTYAKRTYSSADDLSVLLASIDHATGGSPEQAFFFHHGCYLGTATLTDRTDIVNTQATSSAVVLTWAHWKPTDPICCPSLAPWTVTFTWAGHLATSGTFPTESQGL